MNNRMLSRICNKLEKQLRNDVHPAMGATINLLDSFLTHCLNRSRHSYLGTFPADGIPSHIRNLERFQIVVNTSRTDDPPEFGGHFVVIEARPDSLTYIDPLASACKQTDIVDFITSCNRRLFYNSSKIQHNNSVFCPMYCALFILYYHINPTWPLNFSSTDLKGNEDMCMRQINRLINDPRLHPT